MLGAMGDGAPKIGRAAHDDAELEAAEARAEELKERFAFATDDRERQEALRLASEATMRVNTMRAACECPPSIARRAADEASRALKDARHMLEKAEEKQEPAAASPPKPDAAERRVRSSGVYERQSTASHSTRSIGARRHRGTARGVPPLQAWEATRQQAPDSLPQPRAYVAHPSARATPHPRLVARCSVGTRARRASCSLASSPPRRAGAPPASRGRPWRTRSAP